jgi:predicted pyridoxine 5'-phosphate oxidase superfamily flavin-nucleotide-binding protein
VGPARVDVPKEPDLSDSDGSSGSAGEHVLQERYGTAPRARRFYRQQVSDRLNARMIEFVQRMELLFVATTDGRGECDCTLRAGPPGFVRVLDNGHLAWPEYRGNGVFASLGNITENGQVGLLFVDFFTEVIGLHVNGAARVVDAEVMGVAYPDLPIDPVPGRRAERWVDVTVQEAYIHCAKHIPRLAAVPRGRSWGTDDVRRKGGDYFGVAADRTAGDLTAGDLIPGR